MEKKIYTTPTLSVVEFEMNEVICTSPLQSISGNSGLSYGGGGNGPARGKSRDGIWDED